MTETEYKSNGTVVTPNIKYRKDYSTPDYLISDVSLYFKISSGKTNVKCELTVNKNPDSEVTNPQLELNGENLKLLELKLDGVSLPRSSYKVDKKQLTITELPNQFVLEIETEINPEKNTRLEGLYKSGNKYCTQCEAEGFRNITYYPDRPDVMATFTTTIEADKDKYPYLLSNGNLVDKGELENGYHFATWHDPFPKPCYLFALVAGNFDLLEDTYTTISGREVDLKIYVDKGKLNQCQHAMTSLIKAMKWDEDVYGLEYDLDIYMIVAVSDFNMGATENKGLNVFNTCYVLANNKTATDADFEGVESVIAHEYFHNWTGNRVTCRDWFQLSLKEGLTVFRDQEFSSDMNSRAVKRVEDAQAIKTLQFAEDAGPMAHPIRPDSYIEMNNFYTHTVYSKGAEVIRMMQTLLGADAFKEGMKLYFQRHDGQAVTCEDFICAMEDANTSDLTLFRNWYRQAGTPLLDITSHWDPKVGKYTLSFEQECLPTPGQPHKEVFLIPFRLALYSNSGELLDLHIDTDCQNIDSVISDSGKEIIIKLTTRQTDIVFSDINVKPIPSLLRGFSAPVKMNYEYTEDELSLLMAHDNDSYANWDAGQSLMARTIISLTEDLIEDRALNIPETLFIAFKNILNRSNKDPSLVSMAIRVPGLDFLIEQFQQVPFKELVTAYIYLKKSLSVALKTDLLNTYQQSIKMSTADNSLSVGWRCLQNACLSLLAESDDTDVIDLAIKQYNDSKQMTNSLAALKIVAHSTSEHKAGLLDNFYNRWQDEELVLDKWFAVQATNPQKTAIKEIHELLDHADFQLANPNKVRALIASFAKNNLQNFHREDGTGYELLANIILKLNKVNPQIAARLTSSFNNWRKFDKQHKTLMEIQLKRIVEQDSISSDVYEIASKALM